MKIKLKNIKHSLFGSLAIGFAVGLVVMYLYLQPKLTYQGKTTQEWLSKYNTLENYKCTGNDVKDYLKSIASAEAYKEGKSKIIDFSSMSWNAVDKCSNAFEAYQQYEIDNPQPTPTPVIKYITQPSKPTTCFTYNQGTRNEFMQCQ